MRILLQPASGKEPLEHFEYTIQPGVLVQSLEGKVSKGILSEIKSLNLRYISIWGIVPTLDNQPRTQWSNLHEDDIVLFYGKKRFYYFARVLTKTHEKKLAEQLWGVDDQNRTWEYIYFIKEGKQIDIPYKPIILSYAANHVIQGAILLDEVKSRALMQYIESYSGILLDEDLIDPNPQEESSYIQKIPTPKTSEEALLIIETISESLINQPARERIKVAKILARNPRFARLVKEKVKYRCEICGVDPFMQKSGVPYAEAHHIEELAYYRMDDPKKMICVCPTCHRVIHYGNEESFRQRQAFK